MSKHGRYERRKPKKKAGKVILIILCCLVLLLTGIGIAGILAYKDMIGKIEYVTVESQDYTMSDEMIAMMGIEEPTEEKETQPSEDPSDKQNEQPQETTEPPVVETKPKDPDILNVLVVGQSYREGEESRLADTIILVTINKDSKVITLTSFLRDTYVDLPDYMGHSCGWNRINTNYALGYLWGGTGGAMEMTNLCIKNNFGIDVDYNVEVDFEAFRKIIDLLGGVRIELTQAEADYINDLGYEWLQVVEPGENRLFGYEALEYARMRKAEGDSDSDIKRTERQRKLLTALFGKLASKGITGIRDIAYEILPMIKTNMPEGEITQCLLEILPLMVDMTIESGTCPVKDYYWSEYKELPDGGAYVLCFESPQQKSFMMPITEGYYVP